jgi:heptosyltransferase-2
LSAAPPIDPARVRRMLVRCTNWIGDLVMISPALEALRRRFPGARIEAVATPAVADALRGNPALDEVIVFDRHGADRGLAGLLRMARRLRPRRYDVAVLFPKSFGTALMARLAGAPVRIGLAGDGRSWLLTDPVPWKGGIAERHHMDLFTEVARAAGCDVRDPAPSFPLGQKEREWAGSFLEEEGAGRFALMIALHLGASKPARAWHRDRFARAAGEIAERHDAGVLILGGPGDREEAAPVADRLGERAINTCGRSTIRQMAALIARCRLFLGNDSGPMHVAGALGVPIVAIFGPGDPDRTAPRTPRGCHAPVITLTRRFPCSPCRQDFFRECYPAPSGKPMCLESIHVEEAVAAADRILSGSAG